MGFSPWSDADLYKNALVRLFNLSECVECWNPTSGMAVAARFSVCRLIRVQQLVNNRWFALVDLIIVFTYGAVVTIWPQLGGWLLMLVLLPWLIRIISGRITFEKSVLIVPLALVVITAGIGVWAAYERQVAW